MARVWEVHFSDSYNTLLIHDVIYDLYSEMDGTYIEKVTQCQKCGEETNELEVVGTLAVCSDCEKDIEKAMARANFLMSLEDDY